MAASCQLYRQACAASVPGTSPELTSSAVVNYPHYCKYNRFGPELQPAHKDECIEDFAKLRPGMQVTPARPCSALDCKRSIQDDGAPRQRRIHVRQKETKIFNGIFNIPKPLNKISLNYRPGSWLNLERWITPRTIKETFLPAKDFRYPYMEEK